MRDCNRMDIVVPIGLKQKEVAKQSIESLFRHLSIQNLYVISSRDINFEIKNDLKDFEIVFIDEDKLLKGVTKSIINKYFINRIGNSNRSNWYFQQFLKMGFAQTSYVSQGYLVWDADAILLKTINFISPKGKTIITKSVEHHKPYFVVLQQLIGIQKKVNFSFISEHFYFQTKIMKELINQLSQKNTNSKWVFNILDTISNDQLNKSGFSEYETYGNFAIDRYSNLFKYRNLLRLRSGACYFSIPLSKKAQAFLSTFYAYVSFESNDKKSKYSPVLLVLKIMNDLKNHFKAH